MEISVAGLFGVSPRSDPGHVRAFAQAAEGLGFRGLYLPEHVVFFPSYESSYPYTDDGAPAWGPDTGIYDPLFVAVAAAQATTTLRFVTGVLIVPQRPALLTAKELLTVDHFTGGRFELGIGAGWSWEEYAALGVPFERRGRRLDEYLDAMRVAWTQERATYDGEFVAFENAVMNPKPVTPGGPRVIVGGDSAAAMRRAVRRGDGWYGWWVQDDIEAHVVELRAIADEHGRDVDGDDFSIRLGRPLTSIDPAEVAIIVERAAAMGVDELVLAPAIGTRDVDGDLSGVATAAGLGSA
ncbi:MAG: TIGR03619 family F420-dependent LLM class oxidoreductase [Actinomycetota bacterium]